MSEWISVKDRLPDKLEPVNIVWVNREPEPYYSHIKDKPFVANARTTGMSGALSGAARTGEGE